MTKYKTYKVTLYTLQKGTLLVKARTKNEVVNKYFSNKLNTNNIEIEDDGQWELRCGDDEIVEVKEE